MPCMLQDMGSYEAAGKNADKAEIGQPEVAYESQKGRKFSRALAALVIVACSLIAWQLHTVAYAKFGLLPSITSSVGKVSSGEGVLDVKSMRDACTRGWAVNWRNTGVASLCLEPDGFLWRKLNISAFGRGQAWYNSVYAQSALTYNTPFVNYLTRYIINYDPRWQRWWSLRQEVMSAREPEEAAKRLQAEFARLSGSVDYGLSRYGGREGVKLLFAELHLNYQHYGEDAVRQLALSFALLDPLFQPGQGITRIISPDSMQDAAVVSVEVKRQMRELAASALHAPLTAKSGARPRMLPVQVPILQTSDGLFTIPGFVRPTGIEGEELFGTRHAGRPVVRERVVEPAVYLASAVSGLFCCSFMHLVTVPVDVLKTRMQSPIFAGRYLGVRSGLRKLWTEEGWEGITRGWPPTLVGFSYYGLTVYPAYELLKRWLIGLAGEANDALYHSPLVLLAGAAATSLACLGVCPTEATRIRMVSMPNYAPSTMAVVRRIVEEEGFFRGLYQGVGFLLARQVLFGMVKFLVFDGLTSWILSLYAVLAEAQLLVSLLSGAVAGVSASIVSQPADAVLTRMKDSQSLDAAAVISEIWEKRGPQGFFLGLSSRCVWAACIIAGQFLLYDVCKMILQITADDLTLFLDVIGSIEMGSHRSNPQA